MEEHLKELKLSTFSRPILKEMGVKAIFLVIFDIILGPIAYIDKLSVEKSSYLEFLKELSHLGEFYTGIAHAQIDKVTTKTGEELIIGRATRKVNELELVDVAVALVETTKYQPEIVKMLKFAVRTAYGNPQNFSELIDKITIEYQEIGKKKEKGIKTIFREYSSEKLKNLIGMFENWNGLLFIDFEGNKLNSAFLPDWIDAIKIDASEIAEQVKEMYNQGVIIPKSKQKFTMVTLKGKQAIVMATINARYVTVVFPTANGLAKIPQLVQEVDVVNEAMQETGMNFGSEVAKKTLEIIDHRIKGEGKEPISKEVMELMIKADVLMPKKQISEEQYEVLEGELQRKFFPEYKKVYREFDGIKTIMEISHKMNIALEKVADFVLFCKSRGIVQIFTKDGRKK